MTRTLISTGADAFGSFSVMKEDDLDAQEQCTFCGEPMTVQIEYHKGMTGLPIGIKQADTILGHEDNAIGLTCGCYAKFHRQVAHIQDAMKVRKP